MPDTLENLQDAIDAMHTVRLARRYGASGPQFQAALESTCLMLEKSDENTGVHSGIRANVAAALRKTYGPRQ